MSTDAFEKMIRSSTDIDAEVELALQKLKIQGPNQLPNGTLEWEQIDGLTYYHGRLYIPKGEDLRREALRRCHDAVAVGHPGQHATLEEVKRYYWWPGVERYVKRYVSGCDACARAKPAIHPKGPLIPLDVLYFFDLSSVTRNDWPIFETFYSGFKRFSPIEVQGFQKSENLRSYGRKSTVPEGPWQVIGSDLVGTLPESYGYNMILVYVDRFTKQAHFIPCRNTITAEGVADKHVEHVFPLHGVPEKIVSDRGTQFSARIMKELYNLLGIDMALSTAYHPQSNGQTEHTNQELVKFLRLFCSDEQSEWAKYLPMAEFAYNSHVHSATGTSPFELLYGYKPTWSTPAGGRATFPEVQTRLDNLRKAREEAQAALRASKEAMRENSEGARRPRPTFKPGDMAWLDTEDLSIPEESRKLADKRAGPFEVEALQEGRSGPMYKLKLTGVYKDLHPVFSVDRLSRWNGNEVNGQEPTPPKAIHFENQAEPEYEVEKLLKIRPMGRGFQYLVKWKGYTKRHDQWVSKTELMRHAKEKVAEFHRTYSGAPRELDAATMALIPWRKVPQLQYKPLHANARWSPSGTWA